MSTGGASGDAGNGGSTGSIDANVDAPRVDGSVDAPSIDASVDASRAGDAAPDADLHGGASRWIAFTHSFTKCTWFTADQGFCSEAAKSIAATSTNGTDLYKTSDSGRTWTLVATIDGNNSTSADMRVFVSSPTEFWYITGFSGMGFSGSIGHSLDGGLTWTSLTDKVDRALADDPDAAAPLDAPLFDLAQVGSAIWLNTGSWSQYFAMSPDNGATWQRMLGPVSGRSPEFIATAGHLMLRYTTSTWGISLYRLSGGAFVATEGTFPAPSGTDHGDTWWRASPNAEGVAFSDRRAWPFWDWPFLVSATFDQGKTFQSIYTGTSETQSGCEGLRDLAAFVQAGTQVAYKSGIFAGSPGTYFVEIRKSADKGLTWTTLHSEPSNYEYASVLLDPTGKVHAMRHSTDSYGNTFDYDGHYVLE